MIDSRGSVMKGSPSADDVIKGFADYFWKNSLIFKSFKCIWE